MITRLALLSALLAAGAAGQSPPGLSVPARTIPIPGTVSPQMQAAIAKPWDGSSAPVVLTAEQWRAWVLKRNAERQPLVREMMARFPVKVTHLTLGGVPVFRIQPAVVAEENRNRRLVHVHGGAYVFFGGEAATPEAILMAHFGRIVVYSVDYRMPPDFPFPAAVDDAVAVWKAVIRHHTPLNVGLFGTSAGGGLTLATVIRLKELGLPLPGALMAGTPWADLTKTGDTYFTNEQVDNVLGTNDGRLESAAKLYAGGHDLKEPLLSPIYGDLSGFPPTILLSGTRDLFLSNTVRVHQKLLQSGVKAELLVFEGQSHGQYGAVPDAPETAVAFREVAQFFDRHLDR